MTEKLFYRDQYLREFTARVVESKQVQGRHVAILDRTAFYATSGGQPHDTGSLNGVAVQDVVEQEGRIWHFVERPVQGEVKGVVDWDRRVEHMQQHHGQHLLSEALIQVARAATLSFHLGKETCTIDLDRAASDSELRDAERLTNNIIFENRKVAIGWFPLDEVRKMKVRKIDPAIQEPVRIVNVDGFDVQPCSGTHPSSTGQVGSVAVLGSERSKEGARVSFVCGVRVVRSLDVHARILKSVCCKLSAPLEEIEACVDRRLAEEQSMRRRIQDDAKTLAGYLGRELYEAGQVVGNRRLCSAVLAGKEIKDLKPIAHGVLARGSAVVALVSASDSGTNFVVAAGPDVPVDLRPLLKTIFEQSPGKGGGEPRLVQGSFASTDAAAVLALVVSRLR